MYSLETERLIGFSDIRVLDGKILPTPLTEEYEVDIFNDACTSIPDNSFKFYDKLERDKLICHIGIIFYRGRLELTYGTELAYRGSGYMQEALEGLIEWITNNTEEKQIWGIPNGENAQISQYILEKNGFVYYGPVENASSCSWFLYNIAR